MRRYKGYAGDTGVLAYESGGDFIRVQFRNGDVYRYTYASAGRGNVERMKALGQAGRGLSTFISQVVRNRYAEHLKAPS